MFKIITCHSRRNHHERRLSRNPTVYSRREAGIHLSRSSLAQKRIPSRSRLVLQVVDWLQAISVMKTLHPMRIRHLSSRNLIKTCAMSGEQGQILCF